MAITKIYTIFDNTCLHIFVTARRARIFYHTSKTTLCDICDGEDCGKLCKNDPNYERYGGTGTGVTASWLLIAMLLLLLRSEQM